MTLRDLLAVADTKHLVLVDENKPDLIFQASATGEKLDYQIMSIDVQDNHIVVKIKDTKKPDLNDLGYSFDVGV